MKKQILLIFSALLIMFGNELKAQLPEVSSSATPKWYFIQVVGESERAGLVFTAEEDIVYGKQLATDDFPELIKQMWRFELDGTDYAVINRATGQKLEIAYNAAKNINYSITDNTPLSKWQITVASAGGYNIKSTTGTTEKTSAVYAHQANNYDNRVYVIMFESSGWSGNANSRFEFICYEEQAPVSSTQQNPAWYYIEVLGESERAGLVYTVEDNQVFGRSVISGGSLEDMDRQLWRFERSGNAFAIVNKATAKKLDIDYNSDKGINIALLADAPSTNWIIEKCNGKDYFNIKAVTAYPGRSSNIYSHQANNYDSRNYAIIFESYGYRETLNSLYRFIPCEYPVPQISAGTDEVWYIIKSKKSGLTSKCITDVTEQNLSEIRFTLDNVTAGNRKQQWKIVEMGASSVQFVNRATGNIIQTESVYNKYYYTQHALYFDNAQSWTMEYLGDAQYEMYGFNQEGLKVHLNAASNMTESDIYMEGNNLNSGFAWSFKKVSETVESQSLRMIEATTDTDSQEALNIKIYVSDCNIKVEGADNYIIRNISGILMNKTTELPVGIYLVTVNGITTKVLVK